MSHTITNISGMRESVIWLGRFIAAEENAGNHRPSPEGNSGPAAPAFRHKARR
jgi:hypothetical protein